MADPQPAPAHGDVIITRQSGWYSISIVPDRHQLSLAQLDTAVRIATMWAKQHSVRAWRANEGSGAELIE